MTMTSVRACPALTRGANREPTTTPSTTVAATPAHSHHGCVATSAPPPHHFAARETTPIARNSGCRVAAKETCAHREATPYTLSAGPPTPAETFMKPEANPSPIIGPRPRISPTRAATNEAEIPPITATPTTTSSTGAGTVSATHAPG